MFSYTNVKVLDKMAKILCELQGKGNVVLMGDVNGRVGNKGSITSEDTREVVRESEDAVVNEQGVEVLELTQEFGLVLMNGVGGGSGGRARCRGRSVVDWIVMSRDMMRECDRVVVEDVESGGGGREDHRLVYIDWERKRVRREEKGANDETKEGGGVGRKSNGCNLRKGWRDGWKKMREVSDRIMKKWCEKFEGKDESMWKEMMKEWRECYEGVVDDSVGWVKGGRERRDW